MIQAFSLIFNFFNIASPCGDMFILKTFLSILFETNFDKMYAATLHHSLINSSKG
jgi:hypothetical protein